MSDTAPVDFVVPVYGERPRALELTVRGCLAQEEGEGMVWVVDDGSPQPVALGTLAMEPRVKLIRLEENHGISGARNAAIRRSEASWIACVNVDVVPERSWARTCRAYLKEHADVGAAFTPLRPVQPDRLLTRWRMRFHEQKYDRATGPAPFAPGHAVFFRRAAIDAVGGYDPRLKRTMEDSDICERMRAVGWETHYIDHPDCVSHQDDRMAYLAKKQFIRDGLVESASSAEGFRTATRSFANRLIRNMGKGRFAFLPVDFAVYVKEMHLVGTQSNDRRSPTPNAGPRDGGAG